MTDQNKIIAPKNDGLSSELDENIKRVISRELATRLAENSNMSNRRYPQRENDTAENIYSALCHFGKDSTCYTTRQKILINRLFRMRGEDAPPFPEVDTPYERFRFEISKKKRIILRVVCKDRGT